MNLRDLEYLVALDDHRHFGRAAAACYVSQPTLSTQVKKLEAELDAPLVERGSRQVLLTSAGERIVVRARRLLAEADDIRQIARQAKDPFAGTLRIGVFPTLGPYVLPHVIGSLREEFADLEVLLVEETSARLLARLHAGDLDAVVLAEPVLDDRLTVRPLFREEFLLAAPQGSGVGARSGPVGADELTDVDLLLLEDGHCLREQVLDVARRFGARERDGFRATSLETLRFMVASGVGVTLLPRLSVSPPVPEQPDIVLRPFADPVPHRDVTMVWRRSSPRTELLPLVADRFAAVPAGLVRSIPGDDDTTASPGDAGERPRTVKT